MGNSADQESSVNSSFVEPQPGLVLLWAGAGQVGRQPGRGLDLSAVCPEGTQASRSSAISGLVTKSLWK